ncbi:ATP-binding cassette domain-containing protein [Reyranella sp.]|uniref:ABC transporter permease subunit n=1 Tax=Reyranella sp. TaxID=1929291 RepID=UPI00121FA79D|nr:ATP-binding cassette domain-containing protein [Reyranella sp.]TAJ85978.1 MAG: ATP-binding cassette domain-containing protein [Reyranella sp.]
MRALDKFWLAVLILLPVLALLVLPPFGQRMVILVGVYALMGVGYQLVFGQLGALNLAQGALFGVGAYTVALTAPTLGLLSLPVAILAAALPAAIVAGPILRLQSHYFALATLALASLIHLAAVHVESITGGANGLAGFTALLPRGPILLVIVWICLILTIVVQARLFAGPMGERARLLRQAPLVAATLGIDGGRWRLVAFVIGSALAGLAGGLSAAVSGVVSPEITGFPIMVLCLTSVVLGGARHPMGAVLGAAIAVCLPELLRDLQSAWLLAYAAATLLVVLWAPEGLATLIDRWRGVRPVPPVSPVVPAHLEAVDGPQRLTLDGVAKHFGGVAALQGVSFTLERGEVVGLIGANGSGKTTLLNVIGGLECADGGTIMLDERRINHLAPHAIARVGVGRSFQSLALTGDTRTADIAHAIETGASFLLLDEPAAGATDRERSDLASLIARLRAAGRGVLIIDHDIELLSRTCDRLICLDRGAVVAIGRPAEVRANPIVRASFLGVEEAAE